MRPTGANGRQRRDEPHLLFHGTTTEPRCGIKQTVRYELPLRHVVGKHTTSCLIAERDPLLASWPCFFSRLSQLRSGEIWSERERSGRSWKSGAAVGQSEDNFTSFLPPSSLSPLPIRSPHAFSLFLYPPALAAAYISKRPVDWLHANLAAAPTHSSSCAAAVAVDPFMHSFTSIMEERWIYSVQLSGLNCHAAQWYHGDIIDKN